MIRQGFGEVPFLKGVLKRYRCNLEALGLPIQEITPKSIRS